MALPSGYTQLEYITFSGSNTYITTGVYTPTANEYETTDIKIVCKFSTTAANKVFIGGRYDTTNNGIIFGYFSSGSAYVGYGGATTPKNLTMNPMNGQPHTVILSKNLYKLDGVNQTIDNRGTFSGKPTGKYEIFLGTWNNNGTPDSRCFVGNVYSFTIYKNGGRILDYIPCKNSNGTAGFYDVIQSKFVKGFSTALTAGPVKSATTVTYKTVISNAIQGFNDIQTGLEKYAYLEITLATESSSGHMSNLMNADELRQNVDKLSVISDGTRYISTCCDTYDPTSDGGTIG